jgi:hypothetical protein
MCLLQQYVCISLPNISTCESCHTRNRNIQQRSNFCLKPCEYDSSQTTAVLLNPGTWTPGFAILPCPANNRSFVPSRYVFPAKDDATEALRL